MMADLLDLLDRYAQTRLPWWRWWRENRVTWYGFDGNVYAAWRWELPAEEELVQIVALLPPPGRYCHVCGNRLEGVRCAFCLERDA